MKPFAFALGTGQVIGGWDEGVATMRVADKPAYDSSGACLWCGRLHWSDSSEPTLVFEVDMLSIT